MQCSSATPRGGGKVLRLCARHGTSRVSKLVFMSAVPLVMVQKASNPTGLPFSVFQSFRAHMIADRSAIFYAVPEGPFFGFNRPGAKVSKGLIESWWMQSMICGFKNVYDCVKAFSETDFTEDLKGLDILCLIIHEDDDQIVPFADSAEMGIKLLKKGTLKVYKEGAQALLNLDIEEINKDLLEFAKS